MKRTFYFLVCLTLAFLCACDSSVSTLQFSFDTSAPANSSDAKIIRVNQDMDTLELNAELKIDSGNATVRVLDATSNQVLWSDDYGQNASFQTELNDVKADCEYLLEIRTSESKKVRLTITSDEKLVKDKEKPEKYTIG